MGGLVQGRRGRDHVVHAPGGVRRRRHDRLPHRLHRPGGALLGLLRDRQPRHVGRLLRRAGARARQRRAEAPLDRAADGRKARADSARHDRAGRRLGRRLDPDHRDEVGRGLRPPRAEELDLERRHRGLLRRLRDRRPRHTLEGRDGVRRREGRPGSELRRADEEDGPARDPQRGDVPRGRRVARRSAPRRRGTGASTGSCTRSTARA